MTNVQDWDCLYNQLCHVDGDQHNYGRSVPWQILITKDGTRAFVSNSGSGTVSVIDTDDATGHPDAHYRTRPILSQLVTNPEQNKLYVSDSQGTIVMVCTISSLTSLELEEIQGRRVISL